MAKLQKMALEAKETETTAINGIVFDTKKYFKTHVTKSQTWRKTQLLKIKSFLINEKPQIVNCLKEDLSQTDMLLEAGEFSMLYQLIENTLNNFENWILPNIKSAPLTIWPSKIFSVKEPLGVCLIIGVWNFPFLTVLGPLIGAIAAGNCAIIKPSEISNKSSLFLLNTLTRYVDAKAIKVVHGGVEHATQLLKNRFDHIFYTGNSTVAKIIMAAAAKNLTPLTLELGGKNPVIIGSSANIELAAKRIAWAKIQNMGQACVAPDYILVPKNLSNQFIHFSKLYLKQFLGKNWEKCDDLSRIVNERHFERLKSLLLKEKEKIVIGGNFNRESLYIDPTYFLVDFNSPLMESEIFGPLLAIIEISNVNESIEYVNSREKPLALYIFTENSSEKQRILNETSSGGVCLNDALLHASCVNLPFGGVGHSGMGKYNGKYSFDTFSNEKSVLDASTRFDPFLRYPPYTARKIKVIKFLTRIKFPSLPVFAIAVGVTSIVIWRYYSH